MRRRVPDAWLLALLALLAGCGRAGDLEQMDLQARAEPFGQSQQFFDGRAMRAPPAGTVPARRGPAAPGMESGRARGAYLRQVPVAIDARLVARGRDRYAVFCAPCHGMAADGRGPVARFMEKRPPPSLLEESARRLSPGRLFEVITIGTSLMPPLGMELLIPDRWAVVAHIQALQGRLDTETPPAHP